jgi:hypothetical protein
LLGASSLAEESIITARAIFPAAKQNHQENTQRNLDEKYNYKKLENKNLLKTCSGDILEYMMHRKNDTMPQSYMLRHNVPANLRAKIVDWMIEMLSFYKCKEQTFFMAVRIIGHVLPESIQDT